MCIGVFIALSVLSALVIDRGQTLLFNRKLGFRLLYVVNAMSGPRAFDLQWKVTRRDKSPGDLFDESSRVLRL